MARGQLPAVFNIGREGTGMALRSQDTRRAYVGYEAPNGLCFKDINKLNVLTSSIKVEYVSPWVGWMCFPHAKRQQFLEKASPVSQNTMLAYSNVWDLWSTYTQIPDSHSSYS